MPGAFSPIDQRALRAVAVQFFVNGAVLASFLPRLPEIRDRVGISVAGIGVLLSIAGVCALGGSAIVGPAVARFGTRSVMLIAGCLEAMSLAVVGVANAPWVLLVGLACLLTFDVLADVAMNMQGSWLSARRHSPVMNRLHGLWSLGTLVGGTLSSRVADAGISLSAHLLVSSAVLFTVLAYIAPGLLRVDETPSQPGPTHESGRPSRFATWPGMVLVLFGIVGFTAAAVEGSSMDWAAFRFKDDFETTAGYAALGFVAVAGGMTAARFAGDWASVRLGRFRLLRSSIALTTAGLATASFAPVQSLSLAGYTLVGLGVATLFPMLYDTAAQHPGRPGSGLGALTAGMRAAFLGTPVIIGGIAGTRLSVGAAVAIVALPCVFGLITATARLRSA